MFEYLNYLPENCSWYGNFTYINEEGDVILSKLSFKYLGIENPGGYHEFLTENFNFWNDKKLNLYIEINIYA